MKRIKAIRCMTKLQSQYKFATHHNDKISQQLTQCKIRSYNKYMLLSSLLRKGNHKNPLGKTERELLDFKERERERERREMVQTETEGGRCERHPKHLTSVGVCPYCLREALSRLFPASSFGSVASSSSSSSSSTTSSSHYSSLSFFVVSPSHNDLMRPRPSFHFEGSVEERELVVRSKPLMKSQSLVFTRDRKEESKQEEEEEKKKKKGRFWSRLLSGSSKRREEGVATLHSKTFKRNLLPTGFH